MSQLHTVAIDNSNNPSATPVVFLHGFGGVAKQWWGLQTALSFKAPTFSFDLPGHGASLEFPGAGSPIIAAKAVVKVLDELGVHRAHFVGHSMGGAIASLIGLIAPQKVASLTLLAPGGYGSELNAPLLHQWAAAKTAEELNAVMPNFFGPSYDLPEKVVEFQLQVKGKEGATEKLQEIATGMFEGGGQGVLPVTDILAGDFPISVVWGKEDQVLPVSHAEAFDGKADLHIVDDMGHSPAEEQPDLVLSVIKDKLSNTPRPPSVRL